MPRMVANLNSTALVRAEFEQDETSADRGRLDIEFTSGQSYSFENVPQRVFEELRDARSPGTYYHQHIRDRY
jgi:hypothetical protein